MNRISDLWHRLWRRSREPWRAPEQESHQAPWQLPQRHNFLEWLRSLWNHIVQGLRRVLIPPRDYNKLVPQKLKDQHSITVTRDGQGYSMIPERHVNRHQHPPPPEVLDDVGAYAVVRVPIELYATRWLPLAAAILGAALWIDLRGSLAVFVSFAILVSIFRLIYWLLAILWWTSPDYIVGGQKPGIVTRRHVFKPMLDKNEASDLESAVSDFSKPRLFWGWLRINIGHVGWRIKEVGPIGQIAGIGNENIWRWRRDPRAIAALVDDLTQRVEVNQETTADSIQADTLAKATDRYEEYRDRGMSHNEAIDRLHRFGYDVTEMERRGLFALTPHPQSVTVPPQPPPAQPHSSPTPTIVMPPPRYSHRPADEPNDS